MLAAQKLSQISRCFFVPLVHKQAAQQSGFLILFFFLFVTFKDVGDMVGGDEDAAAKLPVPVFTK